jgi:hypothetical protein
VLEPYSKRNGYRDVRQAMVTKVTEMVEAREEPDVVLGVVLTH